MPAQKIPLCSEAGVYWKETAEGREVLTDDYNIRRDLAEYLETMKIALEREAPEHEHAEMLFEIGSGRLSRRKSGVYNICCRMTAFRSWTGKALSALRLRRQVTL